MYKKLSLELGIPEEVLIKVYKYYWAFIKERIEEIPLKDSLNEEFFKTHRTSFNLPGLGKLYCTYDDYKKAKIKYNESIKYKVNNPPK